MTSTRARFTLHLVNTSSIWSLSKHCTQWAKDQLSPSGLEFRLMHDMTQLPWWWINLVSGLVRPQVFQLAVKLAEIFERKFNSNWKVQTSAPRPENYHLHRKTKCEQNWFLSYHKFDPIYPTPPLGQDMTQGQFFKRSLTGLNSEFSFS